MRQPTRRAILLSAMLFSASFSAPSCAPKEATSDGAPPRHAVDTPITVQFDIQTHESVRADPNDPLARDARDFVRTYAVWLAKNIRTSTDEEAFAMYATYHRAFAERCAAHGVRIDPNTDVQSVQYPVHMAPVVAYLKERGWHSGFYSPLGVTVDGRLRTIAAPFIGNIVARKNIAHGCGAKVVPTTQLFVETLETAWPSTYHLRAITEGTTMWFYLSSYQADVAEVLRVLRSDPSEDEDRLVASSIRSEWGSPFEQLGDTPALHQKVFDQILASSTVHELAHTCDTQVITWMHDDRLTNEQRAALKGIIEARAKLVEIRDGPIPIFAFAGGLEWGRSAESGLASGGKLLGEMIGLPPGKPNTNELVAFLRDRARFMEAEMQLSIPLLEPLIGHPQMLDRWAEEVQSDYERRNAVAPNPTPGPKA